MNDMYIPVVAAALILLIAAVIAVAMLAILVPILESIGLINISNPSGEAVNLIKSNYDKPSAYNSTTKAVTFAQNDSLNAKAIAEKAAVGVDAGKICLSMGDFAESGDFAVVGDTTQGNMVLTLKGNAQKVNIGVICDSAADLRGDLSLYDIPEDFLGDCTPPDNSQRYCIIMLRYA